MLRIHILNVGHGDSIVLEFHPPNGLPAFAVIDSNCRVGSPPPAVKLLDDLKAEELSFVAITHPHADHYSGMKAILEKFRGKCHRFYTFPIRKERNDIKKIIEIYKRFASKTDDTSIQSKLLELAQIFQLGLSAVGSWEDPNGLYGRINAPGFAPVEFWQLLPPSKVKGPFFDEIDKGKIRPESLNLNELSMAFLIKYGEHEILLGGDGNSSNWLWQSKRWKSEEIYFSPTAVKLPHHGSAHDCTNSVINILYGKESYSPTDSELIALISANGKTHPDAKVLDQLVEKGIKPYCTNLAKRCGANIKNLVTDPNLDPELLRFINSATIESESSSQVCQGNITLEIRPGSKIKVMTQHKILCQFRGEYNFLTNAIQ